MKSKNLNKITKTSIYSRRAKCTFYEKKEKFVKVSKSRKGLIQPRKLRVHDEIHRCLKSQTPTDVRLFTSAGELCRNKKLLTSQLREGDTSIRFLCDKEIIVQFVNNKLAALKCPFAKLALISVALSL